MVFDLVKHDGSRIIIGSAGLTYVGQQLEVVAIFYKPFGIESVLKAI